MNTFISIYKYKNINPFIFFEVNETSKNSAELKYIVMNFSIKVDEREYHSLKDKRKNFSKVNNIAARFEISPRSCLSPFNLFRNFVRHIRYFQMLI